MGPYHFARMRALAAYSDRLSLSVLETSDRDAHSWTRAAQDLPFQLHTLGVEGRQVPHERVLSEAIFQALCKLSPDVIVTTGYHDPIAHVAYTRFRSRNPGVKLVLWSESTEYDHERSLLREFLKRSVAVRHAGAITAGEIHAQYLRNLGFYSNAIIVAGDSVDNAHFSTMAKASYIPSAARPAMGLPERYFLYVGRLAPEKNLFRMLRAYKEFRVLSGVSNPVEMILVGDGPDRQALETEIASSGIEGVIIAGNKQVDELPRYYANCECLILPSTREPWGLVVNEAMASGRPVLASQRCGSASELVLEGVTGFTFDPFDMRALSLAMYKVSIIPDLDRMGNEAASWVGGYSVERFAAAASSLLVNLHNGKAQKPTRLGLLGQQLINQVWSVAQRFA